MLSVTYVQLQEEPREQWDRGSALTSGTQGQGPTGELNHAHIIHLSRDSRQPSTSRDTSDCSFSTDTKGSRLFRFLLLSTHTRSVCPRCVSLDSAHLACEPLETGFLCFHCHPTTLLIQMWTLLLSWCSQKKKKKRSQTPRWTRSRPNHHQNW